MSVGHSSVGGSGNGALRALAMEYKNIQDEPLEGFKIRLLQDDNLFEWEVAIFGPPDTVYQGGYFKAHMHFPQDYPYSPPTMRFQTRVWHPNVYENGDLCISILHAPVDDPQSGELVCERWNPTQTVRTILLSVVSLLNEPNTSSPANVDAAVAYRKWKESKGTEDEFEVMVKKQVALSREEAEKDGVIVPLTLEDYVVKTNTHPDNNLEIIEAYDDVYDLEYDEGDDLEESDNS